QLLPFRVSQTFAMHLILSFYGQYRMLRRFFKHGLERLHGTTRWENEVAEGWSIGDLDSAEITRTIEEAIRRGRAEDPGTREPLEILRGFGLVKDGAILRAAVVLFGSAAGLLPDYPQCLLRVARFRGVDRTEFTDNRQFRAHAFDLLLLAERYLRENLPIAGRVVPNLFERVDDPLYPTGALREALANAFCHRDYSIGGGSVALGIYDDRLEITSSGKLHFGLTADALYRPHESLPWNPLIAGVFYRRGVIETWGRGTLKMAELTQQAGLPRPDIEEMPGAMLIRFRPSRYIAPLRVGHDLTPRQQEILRELGSERRLALRELGQRLSEPIPASTLRDDLLFLKRLGLIDNAGWGRGASWFLKDARE
ncbi:MAG: ATP-binding protein, partial [Dehalococcoidia bacterium]